jgi:hypothetical protein
MQLQYGPFSVVIAFNGNSAYLIMGYMQYNVGNQQFEAFL